MTREQLFRECAALSQQVEHCQRDIRNLAGIVQNDGIEITDDMLAEFQHLALKVSDETRQCGHDVAESILKWRRKVILHVETEHASSKSLE